MTERDMPGAAEKSRQKENTAQSGSVSGGGVAKHEKKAGKSWKQDQPQKLKLSYKEQREYETIDDDIARC